MRASCSACGDEAIYHEGESELERPSSALAWSGVAVVLLANLGGAILVAYVLARMDVVSEDAFASMRELARATQERSFATTLLRGIFAGWLVALTVWLLPYAETARVWVIGLLTYVMSTWAEFAIGFFLPALIGNVIGGVLLVAVLNHAQIVAGGGTDD